MLDPLPERIEPRQTYTVGYWVMQHATHPYDGGYGKLGDTGLEIVAEDGTTHTFAGVSLGQPAHYAATLAVPRRGTWQLYAMQGIFDEYLIGTLSVPGELTARPLPEPVAGHAHQHQWGLIAPPERTDQPATASGGSHDESAHRHGSAPQGHATGETPATAQADARAPEVRALAGVAVLAGLLLMLGLAGRWLRQRGRAVGRAD